MCKKTILNKIISLTLALVLSVFTFVAPAAYAADENIGVSPNPPFIGTGNEIVPYSENKPKTIWSWSNGQYNFEGYAQNVVLYTNYMFTGVELFKIVVTNMNKSTPITVRLQRSVGGIDFSASTVKIPAGETATWFPETTASLKYYLSFSNPSNFEGYIVKVA